MSCILKKVKIVFIYSINGIKAKDQKVTIKGTNSHLLHYNMKN